MRWTHRKLARKTAYEEAARGNNNLLMIEENDYIVTVRNRQLNIDVTILHPRNLVQGPPGLLDCLSM